MQDFYSEYFHSVELKHLLKKTNWKLDLGFFTHYYELITVDNQLFIQVIYNATMQLLVDGRPVKS